MGWFRNLLNKVRGIKNLPEASDNIEHISFVEPQDELTQYKYDISKMQGKTQKQLDMETLITEIRAGIQSVKSNELTAIEVQACKNIAYSQLSENELLQLGIENLVNRMFQQAKQTAKDYGYIEENAGQFMPSAMGVAQKILEENRIQQEKNSYRITNPRRQGLLNQLGNSALELVKSGQTLNAEELIQYASNRGGIPIDISSQNRAVEMVDVQAAINLAYARVSNNVTEQDILRVGGQDKVLDEMSIQAKMTAKQFQSIQPEEYIKNPVEIMSTMPEIQDQQVEK